MPDGSPLEQELFTLISLVINANERKRESSSLRSHTRLSIAQVLKQHAGPRLTIWLSSGATNLGILGSQPDSNSGPFFSKIECPGIHQQYTHLKSYRMSDSSWARQLAHSSFSLSPSPYFLSNLIGNILKVPGFGGDSFCGDSDVCGRRSFVECISWKGGSEFFTTWTTNADRRLNLTFSVITTSTRISPHHSQINSWPTGSTHTLLTGRICVDAHHILENTHFAFLYWGYTCTHIGTTIQYHIAHMWPSSLSLRKLFN